MTIQTTGRRATAAEIAHRQTIHAAAIAASEAGDAPRCDKCGAEMTTALMGAFCPLGRECEFWTPELEDFINDPGEP